MDDGGRCVFRGLAEVTPDDDATDDDDRPASHEAEDDDEDDRYSGLRKSG